MKLYQPSRREARFFVELGQIQGIKKHGTNIPPLGKVAERSEIG